MEIVNFLKVISNNTRFKILKILDDGEKTVSRLVEQLKLTQPTISHHLKKLEEAELVIKRRYKKWVIYQLNRDYLRKILKEFNLELSL